MAVDSHIQVPKSILRHFRMENGKILHYDFDTDRIRSCGVKRLGIAHGYYSERMEQYLSRTVEAPFLQSTNKIISFLDGPDSFLSLNMDIENHLKRFIKAAAARSGMAWRSFFHNSVYAQFFDDQSNHDRLILYCIESHTVRFFDFENYHMAILQNETGCPFVLPRNCFYVVFSNGYRCIVTPISPLCALALVPDDYQGLFEPYGPKVTAPLIQKDVIWIMNQTALEYEYVYNRDFVACTDKQELQRLQVFLKTHHTELEKELESVCH